MTDMVENQDVYCIDEVATMNNQISHTVDKMVIMGEDYIGLKNSILIEESKQFNYGVCRTNTIDLDYSVCQLFFPVEIIGSFISETIVKEITDTQDPDHKCMFQPHPEILTIKDGVQNSINRLITAANIRKNNNGISTLIDWTEQIQKYYLDSEDQNQRNALFEYNGGNSPLNVYYDEEIYQVPASKGVTNGIQKADFQSLQELINRKIQKMYTESGYETLVNNNSGKIKPPTVIIATDMVIARHLRMQDNSRWIMDIKVGETTDFRLNGHIYITLTPSDATDIGKCNLSRFGKLAYLPTLITKSTNGVNNEVCMNVKTQYNHICFNPVISKIQIILNEEEEDGHYSE